eukprot:scaffold224666_cov18-Tisochrysis_lutea.AAC.4
MDVRVVPLQLDKPLASSNFMYSLALLGVDPKKDRQLVSWGCEAFVSQLPDANSQVGKDCTDVA